MKKRRKEEAKLYIFFFFLEQAYKKLRVGCLLWQKSFCLLDSFPLHSMAGKSTSNYLNSQKLILTCFYLKIILTPSFNKLIFNPKISFNHCQKQKLNE